MMKTKINFIKDVQFDEDTHTYAVDGEIASLSVTELLAKHNLSPSYAGANAKILKDSADYGKKIHKDLENIAICDAYEPETLEGKTYQKYIDEIITPNTQTYAELSMGLNYNGLILGGTADLILINSFTHETIVADHKTTSTVHIKAVTWQVNILDYMAQYNIVNYQRATKFYCYHYTKNGGMEIIPLEKIPDSEIEKLFESELKGEIYKEPTLELADTELAILAEKAEQALMVAEQNYKQAKAEAEKFREKLCTCFEEQNIKTWESPNKIVKVTYIEPTTTKTIDSTKLKNDYPLIYEDCLKETTKKGYVKVTTKL